MLRRLIGIAVTIAILVGLGSWMRDMFFPSVGVEGWQELQDRLDRYSGVAAPSPISSEVSDTPTTAATIASFRAVASSQPPATPTPAPTPSASPLAVNAVYVHQPTAAVSTAPIITPVPTATITPTPIPTAALTAEAIPPASESLTYEGMDIAYINGILSGLNDRRAAHGNAPLPLNASLSAKAQDHAMRMAERGDKLHSGMGLPEGASYGRKYRNNFKDYFGDIRETSDALCREYGLSIPGGEKRAMRYGEWKHDQEDHVVWRDVIRRDIDETIGRSLSLQQFYASLRAQGYVIDVNPNHKYVTVRAPGMQRSVRLTAKSLGADYTPESIAKRILNIPYISVEEKKPKRIFLRKPYKPIKLKGLRALYFRYMYELGFIKKRPRRIHMSKELRAEVRKLDGYAARMRLLNDHRIETLEHLRVHRQSTQEELDALIRERAALHHKKKGADDLARYELTRRTDAITERLRKLRKEIRLCDVIETESDSLREKTAALTKIHQNRVPVSTATNPMPPPALRRNPYPSR